MGYIVKQTDGFRSWIASVKDLKAKIAVARRIERASQGNFGDHKPVGDGVSELRIPTGPGYRVYYTIRNLQIVISALRWRQKQPKRRYQQGQAVGQGHPG